MLEDFDVVSLTDGAYQLVCGGAMFRVEFDDPAEKAMFDAVAEQRTKPAKTVFRRLAKSFSRPQVLAFFDKLRLAGIMVYQDEDALEAGRVFGLAEGQRFQLDQAAAAPAAIVSTSALGPMLKTFEIFAQARMVDARKLADAALIQALDGADFVIVDAAAPNPAMLDRLNRHFLEREIPWLLVQGVQEKRGQVGPLFAGHDTGCFHCLRERMRSNVTALDAFDEYERWLRAGTGFGREAALGSTAFLRQLAAIAAMEAEKYLLNLGLPQSYGYLLSVDPQSYRVEHHRLYKLPFCEVCNPNFEYRRAPWLDSVTLGAA